MRARRPCPPAAPAAVDAAERAPRNNTIRWFRARAMLASAASAAKRLLVTTIEPRTRIVNCFFFLKLIGVRRALAVSGLIRMGFLIRLRTLKAVTEDKVPAFLVTYQ